MKKIFVLLAAFFAAIQFSKAQTEKGTQTLGTNFGFNYTNVNDNATSLPTVNTKTGNFNIGPVYSYFIKDNLEIGASLSYASSKEDYYTSTGNIANTNYPINQTADNYSASIFIRKYFMYKNKIGFRTGAYIGYSGGDAKSYYSTINAAYDYSNKTNYYSAGANLDLVYYPTKKIGLSATLLNLEYYHYKSNATTQGSGSADNFTFNLVDNGVALSIFYVFGAK
jgi:hypothetical protein